MKHANEPRDHHFTPQGFLKQWANENGEIWRTRIITYGNKVETKKQKSTSAIAKSKDLYNINVKYRNSLIIRLFTEYAKVRHNYFKEIGLNLETSIFDQVDNDGLVAYNKLLDKEDFRELSQSEAGNLFRFFCLLQARNPFHLDKLTKVWTKEFKHLFQEKLSGTGFNLEDLSSDGNAGKLMLLDIALDQSISKRLYDQTAVLIVNLYDEWEYFITSNYPYVSMPDIGSDNALHIIPLSPKLCLLMSPQTQMISFMQNSVVNMSSKKYFADMVNFVVSAYSSEIYSWSGDISKDTIDCLGLYKRDPERSRQTFRAKLDMIQENL